MSAPNEREDGAEHAENAGAEACCASGCGCSAGTATGRVRWIVGIVILVVAGVLVAGAMVKERNARDPNDEATFAIAVIPEAEKSSPAVAAVMFQEAGCVTVVISSTLLLWSKGRPTTA